MAAEFVTTRDGSGQRRLLLPPGEISEFASTETPRNDAGSFLISKYWLSEVDEPRRLPTDPATGLPYAILPGQVTGIDEAALPTNYHHHFYNRRHPDLEGTHKLTTEQLANPELIPLHLIAGLAVRISRGQLLPIVTHNRTHLHYPLGPKMPHTIGDKFVTAVKAGAGLVSRFGLDVSTSGQPKLTYMDDDTFERVASPRLLCAERGYYDRPANHRRRILGSFYLRYAAAQDLGHVPGRIVDEFLCTHDDARRIALGNLILREAMEVGLAPVLQEYRELRDKGMVHTGRPPLRSTVWKCIHPDRRPLVLETLREHLAA